MFPAMWRHESYNIYGRVALYYILSYLHRCAVSNAQPICSALFFFQRVAHNYTARYTYTCLSKTTSTFHYSPVLVFPAAAIEIEMVQQL